MKSINQIKILIYLIFFCTIIINACFSQELSEIPFFSSPQYVNIKKFPRYEKNILFVKIRSNSDFELTYSDKSGFKNKQTEIKLSKLFAELKIRKIFNTFTRIKDKELNKVYTIEVNDSLSFEKIIEKFSSFSDIEYIERVPVYYNLYTPNDIDSLQYYISQVKANLAWDITQGLSSVRIAIVDDEVYIQHNDLKNKIWINSGEISSNSIDDDGNGYIDDEKGYDVADNDNNVNPPFNSNTAFTHGTHVAGIAGAETNNASGMASVGFNCSIIPIKCKPDTSTGNSLPFAYLGLEYAIAIQADIINMSWGGFGYSNTYQLLCQTAYFNGCVLVAAAGNTGTEVLLFPASYKYVISVASCNQYDHISYFSNYNGAVDVVAPGEAIFSSLAGGIDNYGVFDGTSMATPIVSGICALIKSYDTLLTPSQIECLLKNGCTDINSINPMRAGFIGSGRVNAYKSLLLHDGPPIAGFLPTPLPPIYCPGQPVALLNTTCGAGNITYQWIISGGTPSTSTQASPSVTFNANGTYIVTLIACNALGCDTASQTIFVHPPIATLYNGFNNTVCAGSYTSLYVTFQGTPPFTLTYYKGDSLITLNNLYNSPSYIPVTVDVPTAFTLATVSSSFCQGTVSGNITLYPIPCEDCGNMGFETGNFTGWEGTFGFCCGYAPLNYGTFLPSHSIMQGGSDPVTNDSISFLPEGGGVFSARIGDLGIGAQTSKLKKTYEITQQNAKLTYQYAVVLEDPYGHPPDSKPKFEIRLMDQNGDTVSGPCGYYKVTAGTQTQNWQSNGDFRFKNWTTVGVDLTQYIGQNITIEFTAEDCSLGAHLGYAYINVSCSPMFVHVNNFCEGADSITLTAPGGFIHYQWVPYGDTTQIIVIPTPLVGDTVIVNMENEAGCPTSAVHVFMQLPAPTLIASGDTTICLQDSVTLQAHGSHPYCVFNWSSDLDGFILTDSIITVQPIQTTVYRVSVASIYGCLSPDSVKYITVYVDSSLAFNLGNDTILCQNDSIILSSTTTGLIYQWSSNPSGIFSVSPNINVSPDVTTTYFLIISNNLCNFKDSIKVTPYGQIHPTTNTLTGYCPGDTGMLISAPFGYSTYQWDYNNLNSQYVYLHPLQDSISLQVVMMTSNGCIDTLNFLVISSQIYPVQIWAEPFVCEGYSTVLSAHSDDPNAQYLWTSNPVGFNSQSSSIIVVPEITTKYYVTYFNQFGCTDSISVDSATINVLPVPVFNLGTDTLICHGNSITLNPHLQNGFFFWTSVPSGIFSDDSLISILTEFPTTIYLKYMKDGCSYTDDIYIDFRQRQYSDTTVFFCSGTDSLNILAPVGTSNISWSDGLTTGDLYIFHTLFTNETITAFLSNTFGCPDTITYHLIEDTISFIFIDISKNDTICRGTQVDIYANGAASDESYQWSTIPSGFLSNNPHIGVSPDSSTVFVVQIINPNNCISDNSIDTIIITVIQIPYFNLGADTIICQNDCITLSPNITTQSYIWLSFPVGTYSNNQNINICPVISTTYSLTVKNFDCIYTDSINVTPVAAPQHEPVQIINFCEANTSVAITAPSGFDIYLWKPGMQTDSSILVNNIKHYDSLIVYLSTNSGCYDSMLYVLNRLNYHNEIISDSDTTCKGNLIHLTTQFRQNAYYIWKTEPEGFFNNKISITDTPIISTTYYLFVDSAGCKLSDTIKIFVIPFREQILSDSVYFCPGDIVSLISNISGEKYLWNTGETTPEIHITEPGFYTTEIKLGICKSIQNFYASSLAGIDPPYIPNVISSNNDGINDFFYIKPKNINEFNFSIFTRWGIEVYHSTDSDQKWNGQYDNKPLTSGTYYYILSYIHNCSNKKIIKTGFITVFQ